MRKILNTKLLFLAALFLLLAPVLSACGGGATNEDGFTERGRYIYDERGMLPPESEAALALTLWQLDVNTGYEEIVVIASEMMTEDQMIEWFNEHGVGKEKQDNGAAVFVFPDNSVFVLLGSGSDKFTVTKSKTYGEKIFADFEDDPVLTLLRFINKTAGEVDTASQIGYAGSTVKNNMDLVLLWGAVLALIFFLVQQFDGFQKRDLILPGIVFVVLAIVIGIGSLGSGENASSYKTYGMITDSVKDSHSYTEQHCSGSGKTRSCWTHFHTRYINNVQFYSYELNMYKYKFTSVDSKRAWNHEIGDVDGLRVHVENGKLRGVSSVKDNSGGVSIGDGTWILSGKQ